MQSRSIHRQSTQVSVRGFNHMPRTMWCVWLPSGDRGWAASPSVKDAATAFEVQCHRWSSWPDPSLWRHNSQLPTCVYVMAFKLVYFVQFKWKIRRALAYVQVYILPIYKYDRLTFVKPIEFHLNTYRPTYANAFTFVGLSLQMKRILWRVWLQRSQHWLIFITHFSSYIRKEYLGLYIG